MVEIREIVVVTVDYNGCRLDFSGVIPSRGGAADGQSEAKCEETDASHEGEDETKEADLLSPGPLLLWRSDTTSSEEGGRNAACDSKAIEEPAVFRTGAKGIQPTMVILRGLWSDARTTR